MIILPAASFAPDFYYNQTRARVVGDGGFGLVDGNELNFLTYYYVTKERIEGFGVANSSSMLRSVAISYVVALLQLAIVYGLTSEYIKAWFINKVLQKASDNVARTLREYGVTQDIHDVLGTRMGRVRQKVLKVIQSSKELEALLAKVNSSSVNLLDRFGLRSP